MGLERRKFLISGAVLVQDGVEGRQNGRPFLYPGAWLKRMTNISMQDFRLPIVISAWTQKNLVEMQKKRSYLRAIVV